MTACDDPLLELNLDGLVGPTHNYSGLAHGNLASARHQGLESNPRAAALEGLAKMRTVMNLGVPQGVLPPHPRPNLPLLRNIGFLGDLVHVIERAAHSAPALLAASYSASAMWTANAATVCPAVDNVDGRTHFTPANLVHSVHRHQEALETTRVLRLLFSDPEYFVVHDPLPPVGVFADEGAANHTRLQTEQGSVQLFAWGKTNEFPAPSPQRFAPRQSLEASRAIARLHGLLHEPLFWQQHPEGIDAGAFHTDVLAVGTGSVLLVHEQAFTQTEELVSELERRLGGEFRAVVARCSELNTEDAVRGYAFNSQLLTLPNGCMHIVAPQEAWDSTTCRSYLERAVAEVPLISGVTVVPVRQSMANGGGPACLRLRVPLRKHALDKVSPSLLVTDSILTKLEVLVRDRYRDRVTMGDLSDPAFARESLETYSRLMGVLGLEMPRHEAWT